MGTGLAAVVVVIVALLAMAVWVRAKRARYGVDPTETPRQKQGLPEDRPTAWDPRERYE